MKAIMIKLAAVMLVAVLAILAVAPIEVASSEDGRTWMQRLDGDTKISEMTIPGTHDSGALHSIADVAGRCQTLGIESQLNIGVRFFDIRLGQAGSELHVVHSFVDQAQLFTDTLDTMARFVEENPSEFLIVSIKEDLDAIEPTLPFSAAVMAALDKHSDVVDFSSSLPKTLDEARGRIYIMSRFNASYGIPMYFGWEDSATFEIGDIYVQDNYNVGDVSYKITDIESAAETTKLGIYSLVLNYTSCYLNNQAFPPTYAGTPAMEINPWLYDYLTKSEGNIGVIITDFMTERLASAIYGRNFG